MTDIRLQRLADVLVNYSTKVQPGQWVGILGDVLVLPALREIYRKVIEAGGNPTLMLSDDTMLRDLLLHGTDEQLAWLDPGKRIYYETADTYIRVGGVPNTHAMSAVSPARRQAYEKAQRYFLNTRLDRSAEGKMQWVGCWFPNDASAQDADMSLEDYEDFVYRACFCDREDPVAAWLALRDEQQRIVDWLQGRQQFTLKGPNIDLTLSVAGRTFINSHGERNMPDGEVFTGPVEQSVNGWVRYTYPSMYQGRAVEGIELRFVNGRVEQASAARHDDVLQTVLNTDPGARYLGEFAIGTNFGIDRFTGQILFDEKIGGTIHTAVGRAYKDTGATNESAVHWDMICDMRTDSEIHVDGELFYKDGKFMV